MVHTSGHLLSRSDDGTLRLWSCCAHVDRSLDRRMSGYKLLSESDARQVVYRGFGALGRGKGLSAARAPALLGRGGLTHRGGEETWQFKPTWAAAPFKFVYVSAVSGHISGLYEGSYSVAARYGGFTISRARAISLAFIERLQPTFDVKAYAEDEIMDQGEGMFRFQWTRRLLPGETSVHADTVTVNVERKTGHVRWYEAKLLDLARRSPPCITREQAVERAVEQARAEVEDRSLGESIEGSSATLREFPLFKKRRSVTCWVVRLSASAHGPGWSKVSLVDADSGEVMPDADALLFSLTYQPVSPPLIGGKKP